MKRRLGKVSIKRSINKSALCFFFFLKLIFHLTARIKFNFSICSIFPLKSTIWYLHKLSRVNLRRDVRFNRSKGENIESVFFFSLFLVYYKNAAENKRTQTNFREKFFPYFTLPLVIFFSPPKVFINVADCSFHRTVQFSSILITLKILYPDSFSFLKSNFPLYSARSTIRLGLMVSVTIRPSKRYRVPPWKETGSLFKRFRGSFLVGHF